MKKLLIGLGLSVSLGVSAQNFSVENLLAVGSLAVTNGLIASSGGGYTNINSYGVYGSNVVGEIYTNLNGTRVIVAAGNASETAKLTRDIDLTGYDRNGNYPPVYFDSASTNANTLQSYQPSSQSLFLRVVGQSGANSAVTFIFVPVPDGVNESTVAGDAWQIAVTANTTTPVTLVTNLPIYRWHGVKSMRLKSITNGDADASSRVDVLVATVNGPVP